MLQINLCCYHSQGILFTVFSEEYKMYVSEYAAVHYEVST